MFDALDTPGGHIVICIALLGVAALFVKLNVPPEHPVVVFALGVLARSMMGKT